VWVPEQSIGDVCKTSGEILPGCESLPTHMRKINKTMDKNINSNSEKQKGLAGEWLKSIDQESLLPVVNKDTLKENLELCIEKQIPPRFIVTLCPVMQNIDNPKPNGPTRRILPFDPSIPRLSNFPREVISLIVGTQLTLGVKPNILILINDIFEPRVEERIENIDQAKTVLNTGKQVLHNLFQEIDSKNSQFWPLKVQKSIKIVLQSDFVKPLQRFDLPSHQEMVKTLMTECLDPKSDAFKTWVWFLQSTRNDPLMTPNAWEMEKSAKLLHERVRFLTAMYWTDGIINPLLFRTIFQSENSVEKSLIPIFICGVTRTLQAEMEMAGPNLKMQTTSLNSFERILKIKKPSPVIHIFKNTAMWSEPANDPFSFNKKCNLI